MELNKGSLDDIEGELDKLLGTLRSQKQVYTTDRILTQPLPHPTTHLAQPSAQYKAAYADSKSRHWDTDRLRSQAILNDHQNWLRKFNARHAVLQRNH